MTAAQILTFTRNLINEQDTSRVSDATLNIHGQSALEAFNRRVGYGVKLDGSITITATTDFALPTDCCVVLVVEWNGIPLAKGSIANWKKRADTKNWRSKTGTPEEYAVIGRRIYLYPAPDAAAVNADSSLLVQYIRAAGAFADAELAFICDQDHRILAYFMAAEWAENPANSILGDAYAKALYNKFEVETGAVAQQYNMREVAPEKQS